MFKFLHISDTHLGYVQYKERQRARDMARSLARALQEGIEEKVNFVVLAGDVFEKRDTEAEFFMQSIKALQVAADAGIPVYTIAGNHDKAYHSDKDNWLSVLNQMGLIHLLSHGAKDGQLILPAWDPSKRRGAIIEPADIPVRIVGVPHVGSRTKPYIPLIADALPRDERFNLLMMHCGLTGQIPNTHDALDPGEFDPLRAKTDYLALGHYHKRYEIGGWIYNPGGTENRSVYETNIEHGFNIVTVNDDNSFTIDFREGSRRPFHVLHVAIEGDDTTETVLQKTLDAATPCVKPEEEACILHITIRGTLKEQHGTLDFSLIDAAIKEQFGDNLLCLILRRDVTTNEAHISESPHGEIDLAVLEMDVFTQQVPAVFPEVEEASVVDVATQVAALKSSIVSKEPSPDVVDAFHAWRKETLPRSD